VGAPGVGKGTQAKRLAADLGVPHVSTGDMFRDAIRRDTPLGRQARVFIDQGSLVPDDLTIGLIEERFGSTSGAGKGFILDGFPRTLPQAKALERLLERIGQPLEAVVVLDITDDGVVERITGRRSCVGCGTPYHLRFRRPVQDGICDICQNPLVQRADDTEDKVRRRLEKYRSETQMVIPFYEEKGLVKRVDGSLAPDEVYRAVRATLGLL
jgi:adenylate kinase